MWKWIIKNRSRGVKLIQFQFNLHKLQFKAPLFNGLHNLNDADRCCNSELCKIVKQFSVIVLKSCKFLIIKKAQQNNFAYSKYK